jgi:hypothetical protein
LPGQVPNAPPRGRGRFFRGTRDAAGLRYETLAICRSLAVVRAAFKEAIAEKRTDRFMIRSRTRVVKRYPKGD